MLRFSIYGGAAVLLALSSRAPVAHAQTIDSVIVEQANSGSGLGSQPVVTVDDDGNRYVFGNFEGSVTFGEGDASQTLDGTNLDLYVAKYDAAGQLVWVQEFETGSTFSSSASAGGIDFDGVDALFIAGHFAGRLRVGPRELATPGSGANSFVARLDTATGEVEWVNQISGSGVNLVRDLDSDGNCAIAGRFSGSPVFEGTFGSSQRLAAFTPSGDDAFVALYDPAGQLAFVRHAGTDGAQGLGVHVNITSLYLVGDFSGTALFDNGRAAPIERVADGSSDGFIARYDSGGNLRAVETVTGPDTSTAMNVTLRQASTVYFTGQFRDRVRIGTRLLTSRGETDSYIARYDALFDRVDSVVQIGGPGRDLIRGFEIDARRNLHVAGVFTGDSLSVGSGGAAVVLDQQPSGRQTPFLASVTLNLAPRSGQIVLGDLEPNRIAIDDALNLHVVGGHRRELTFGTGDDLLVVPAPAQGTGSVLATFLQGP